MNKDMLDLYIYYVNEREKVQSRREAGNLPPWTMDKVLQHHHFCNNRRENDRGTKEIRAVVHRHHLYPSQLPATYTLARLLNSAASLDVALHEGIHGLKKLRDQSGAKIFNTAYVVSTCGERIDKLDYVERLTKAVRDLDVPRTSLREGFEALRTVPGLGSFLAGQVVADLKNDRYLSDAEDWYTFAVMGPGSKKGLDFIFGPGTTERTFKARLDLLAVVTNGKIPKLHRQDLQNTLCEFSKYVRYKENLPGRRRKYK